MPGATSDRQSILGRLSRGSLQCLYEDWQLSAIKLQKAQADGYLDAVHAKVYAQESVLLPSL